MIVCVSVCVEFDDCDVESDEVFVFRNDLLGFLYWLRNLVENEFVFDYEKENAVSETSRRGGG